MSASMRRGLARAVAITVSIGAVVAGPAVAQAAPTWLTPIDVTAPGQDALFPQVTVDGAGNPTAVFSRSEGTNLVVQAARRTAGAAAYAAPQTLSAAGRDAVVPQVSSNADGDVIAVWMRSDGANLIVRAAGRPSGASSFSAPEDLSAPGRAAANPQVAIDPDGRAIAVWYRYDGTHRIVQAATRPAGAASFAAPENLSAQGQDAYNPQITIDGQGAATVVWYRSSGGVQAATRPASAAAFSAPQDISAPGQNAYDPQVTSDAQGNVTAVWTRGRVVQAATRRAGTSSFSTPEDLSIPAGDVGNAQVSSDPQGDTTAVWIRSDGENSFVQAASRPAGGPSFSAPQDVSAPGHDASLPQVTTDGRGNATAIWIRDNGANLVVQAATRLATAASFAAPRDLSDPDQDGTDPQIAADAEGNATAVWDLSEGENTVVQSAVLDAAGPDLTGFSVSAAATVGTPVTVSASATDRWSPPVTTTWDFGDGTTAAGATVTHTYTTPGTYAVTVRAADANDTATTRTATIVVRPVTTTDTTRPRLTDVSVTPNTISRGGSSTLRFKLSEPARATATVDRVRLGRRVGGHCVAPRAQNEDADYCPRFTRVASASAQASAGPGSLKLPVADLPPGVYRIYASAVDFAGNRSGTATRYLVIDDQRG